MREPLSCQWGPPLKNYGWLLLPRPLFLHIICRKGTHLMLLKWFPCKLYLTTNLICSAGGFPWGTISLSRLTPWVLPHLLGHMGPYWVEMIPRYMGPRVAQVVGLLFSVHTHFLNYFLIECVFLNCFFPLFFFLHLSCNYILWSLWGYDLLILLMFSDIVIYLILVMFEILRFLGL